MKYQTEIQIPFPNFSNRDTDDEKQLKIIKNKIENPSEKLKNLKKSIRLASKKNENLEFKDYLKEIFESQQPIVEIDLTEKSWKNSSDMWDIYT